MNTLRSRLRDPSLRMGFLPKDAPKEGNTEEPGSSSIEPVQVEPKTFFANERTFIQWISAALLLLTVSSIMMTDGSYNGTSSIIAFSALILVGYSAFIYFRRVHLLMSGTAYGYLDIVGPAILAAGVGLGVFIVFSDAVKGSDIIPQRKDKDYDDDRRRLMMESHVPSFSQQDAGKCFRRSTQGLNLLEFLPRDVSLSGELQDLLVATPQTLVLHSRHNDNKILTQVQDSDIQSVVTVGEKIFALSTGPSRTELIQFNSSILDSEAPTSGDAINAKYVIQDFPATSGSMTFVPSDNNTDQEGKFYIHLDGVMHSYQLLESKENTVLSRTGTVNMKVMTGGETDPITSMTYFEGTTYLMRPTLGVIDAWDLTKGIFLAETSLPVSVENPTTEHWVGMAFERQPEAASEGKPESHLRKQFSNADSSSLVLHMTLDTLPPQIWTFHLEGPENGVFSFPHCDGMASFN